jgi:hypothetical protein
MSNYIGEFISNEGKKWPVSGLCIDTSYYITKILAKYHGAKMYDGLFSATSANLGHLGLQTYVNGESHEECRPLLESFVETQKTFGHPLPRIVVSDMPGRDESLIHEIIPSVKTHQEELDRMAALQLEVRDEEQTALPYVELSRYTGSDGVNGIYGLYRKSQYMGLKGRLLTSKSYTKASCCHLVQ